MLGSEREDEEGQLGGCPLDNRQAQHLHSIREAVVLPAQAAFDGRRLGEAQIALLGIH